MQDAPPAWTLDQVAGPELERSAALTERSVLVLGRGLDCDLPLADPGVSRRHARLRLGPAASIEDLGSTAGTFVNEQRIHGTIDLRHGDLIAIGPWAFRVETRAGLDAEATLRPSVLASALAAPRLERLLAFSGVINRAQDNDAVLQALVEAARGVSGFDRALVVDADRPEGAPLAASPPGRRDDQASRTLVERARAGGVVELCRAEQGAASNSMVALQIVSAIAVAVRSGERARYVLYLDQRSGESPVQPDTARFCEALARMAELALDRIDHAERLRNQRERIYSDLHDDLGARLLNQVYRAPDGASRDEARAMLQDLRDVVSRPTGVSIELDELLGEIRAEAAERLAGAGRRLDWPPAPLDRTQRWDAAAAALLSRSLRELVSNGLRHGEGPTLKVRAQAAPPWLMITLTQPGPVTDPSGWTAGRGQRSLQDRARRLGGAIEWMRADDEGLRIELRVPLQPEVGTA